MNILIQIPLNLIVVKVLSSGELSGYDLMKKVKEETGYWKPSPGTMYPLLEKLQKRGLITSRISGKKKIYSLTHKAKIYLKIADAKKAAMAKYAICCLRTYKFLFGDDVTVPLAEEDEHIQEYAFEMAELRGVMLSVAGQKDPKKAERIRKALRSAYAAIKKINSD